MPALTIANKTVTFRTDVLVGGDATCTLQIRHDSVAERHARIFTDGQTWFIEDLLSAKGTRVNDAFVTGVTRLTDGDRIHLGSVAMCFVAEASAPGQSPDMTGEYVRAWSGKEVAGILVGALDRIETTGPVFRAKHALTGVEVLFWVITAEIVSLEGASFFERFKAATAPLLDPGHPHVIRIFQVGQHQGAVWYITAPPTGTSLSEMLARGFSPHAAIETALGLCRLLAVMHQSAVIHGELRPSLVHLDKHGQVRLGSIGLTGLSAATCRTLQLRADSRQGRYLDAEQAETGNRNVKSELYSVGCMLVEMIAGQPPFLGDSPEALRKAHAEGPIPRLASGAHLPLELDNVIQGLLCKSHLCRFDDFATAVVALERLLYQPSGAIAGGDRETPRKAGTASGPLLRRVLIDAAAATLLIGGFLLYRSARDPHTSIYDLAIPPAPTIAEQDLPAVQESRAVVASIHPLRQSGWSACRAQYGNGTAVLLSDQALSVSDTVHAVPVGRIYITSQDPPRIIAREDVADPSQLPPEIIDCQLLMHVDHAIIARFAAAKKEQERSERERKAEQARQAEVQRLQAEAVRSRSEAEKSRLALEREAKAVAAAREAARKELQLRQDAEARAADQLISRSEALAATIAELHADIVAASTIHDRPMDRFTVPRSYADDIAPLLDRAYSINEFAGAHADEATAIYRHADYRRLQAAVKNAQELSQVASLKFERFKEASIEAVARAERERADQEALAERLRANRAADQARREAAAETARQSSSLVASNQVQNTAMTQRRYNSAYKYWETWDASSQQWYLDNRWAGDTWTSYYPCGSRVWIYGQDRLNYGNYGNYGTYGTYGQTYYRPIRRR